MTVSGPLGERTLGVTAFRLTVILLLGVALLVLANVLAGFVQFFTGRQVPALIDVAKEQNIPTWYNSMLLAFAGVLSAIVAKVETDAGGARLAHWWVLALMITYVSIDELAVIHERVEQFIPPSLTEPFGEWILVHPWVIVGLPLVVFLAIAYLPFLRDLPSPTRRWFVLAGVVYAGGALGGESLHGVINTYVGGGVGTSLAILLEEGLEMVGVVIFIHGLLSHLVGRDGVFAVEVH